MNKNIYNYCKALYKKDKSKLYSLFLKKIIAKIDFESKKSEMISPIIDQKTTYIISGFENYDEISEFVFRINFVLKNNYELLLLNTKIDFFIDNNKLISVIEYNNINKPFIENIFELLSASDLDLDTQSLGLKKELLNSENIEPYHIQIPNRETIKTLFKKKK